MVKMQEHMYKVRPSSRVSPKDTFRIFLSAAQLSSHKFRAGDTCHIETSPGFTRPAVVWPAYEKIRDDVVQTSKALQVLYGMKLDSRVSIRRGDVATTGADEINLREIPQNESESTLPTVDKDDRVHWEWLLKYHLCNAELLAPGMTFDHVEAVGEERSFQIQSINSSSDPALYRAGSSCVIRLNDGHAKRANSFEHGKSLIVTSEGIGGLGEKIEELNLDIGTYNRSSEEISKFLPQKRGGILLHGISGTGKSKVLSNVCKAGWRKVFHIDTPVYSQRPGERDTAIHRKFSEALGCQPSVIIIDDLQYSAAAQNPADHEVNIGPILIRELDRLDGTQTLAVGATRSLTKIDQNLRRGGRFDLVIEIPVPDPKARAEILKAMCALPKDKAHATLDRVAARTHGFVAADLDMLIRQAVRAARTRAWKDQSSASESTIGDIHRVPPEPVALFNSMEDDFNEAMRKIRPTALHSVTVETPKTKWSDIGGQHEAKKRIGQATWPFKVDPLLHHYILSVTVANEFVVPRRNAIDWHPSNEGAPIVWPTWMFQNHDRKSRRLRVRSELHCS